MKHELYDREDELHHCKLCGGAEASLPIECPGRRMSEAEIDGIQQGTIQYVHRKWWGQLQTAASHVSEIKTSQQRSREAKKADPEKFDGRDDRFLREEIADLRAALATREAKADAAPVTKEWCMTMANLETEFDGNIEAGVPPARVSNTTAGAWAPCTPDLLNSGVDCEHTPRRDGGPDHSHDHFVTTLGGVGDDAARYAKLRRWMSSNVPEGWSEVEKLGALACYTDWSEFDRYLDSLTECNVGLCHRSAAPSTDTGDKS